MSTRLTLKKWLPAAVLCFCCIAILFFAHRLSLEKALNTLSQQTNLTADLFSANIESTVNRYSYLPKVLAANPTNFSTLVEPTEENTHKLSIKLERANIEAGTLNIYLMARDGTTIASSNYTKENSFVGKNFSFRPYFRFAIAGTSGRYFALGATTQKRGYYFSAPVRHETTNEVVGVMVVKAGLEQLEESWKGKQPVALLTDQYGVVFSGNKKQWHFKSLSNLSPEVQDKLQKSKQYYGKSVEAISQLSSRQHGDFKLLTTQLETNPEEYLHLKTRIAHSGWWLHTLANTSAARNSAWQSTVSVSILLALIAALSLYYRQRRKTWAVLQQAKISLEDKVIARTSALTIANEKLVYEVHQKETAYKALRDTQEKLLHNNRLATIGEMSTAVTHELNQPITAISAYAENAKTFLSQGLKENVSKNLSAILSLSRRMTEITTILKNHARKGDDQSQCVYIQSAIDNALSIVKPRIDSLNITINTLAVEHLIINTSPTRLEQVLVNLLANACDAVSSASERTIQIRSSVDLDNLSIDICDSGTGIDPNLLDEVFEPFFTTKGSNRGLGLGLSISQSIIKNLNGSLTAKNHKTGGACFCVRLPLESDL